MEAVLIYLLFANLSFAILYLCYRLLMRSQENFSLNRWIMVSILCVSMLIPLIPMPTWGETGGQSRWFLALRERPVETGSVVSEENSVSGAKSTVEPAFVAPVQKKQSANKPLLNEVQNTSQATIMSQRSNERHISLLQILFWLYVGGVILFSGRFLKKV